MNTPEQNIVNTLTGKKVLFIENDSSLDDIQAELESILIKAGIDTKTIYRASQMPMEDIVKAIDESDCIVFLTEWLYKTHPNIAVEYKTKLIDDLY